jgi:hypothetical protein
MRSAQQSHHVIGDQPTGVANDVGVTAYESEHRKEVDPRIHAGQHRDLAPWPRV